MITSLRNILENNHTPIEETSYCPELKELFDYPIVSGDFYEITGSNPGEKEIRFKNTVDVLDFSGIAQRVSELSQAEFPDREQTPYFTANLSKLEEALDQKRPVAVEGGPCLFGAHEVDVEIILQNGESWFFDYCTGKNYGERTGILETDMESFIKDHAHCIEKIYFHNKKKGLTHQEYESLLYIFEAAKALNAVAVIPLPDMSYVKYLLAVIAEIPEEKKKQILKDFREVSWRISDLYIEMIRFLEERYPEVKCLVVHERNTKLCERFFQARVPYIERNKILRMITAMPNRMEAVKDYISMPALPFYLLGIKDILEIDSVDETDSYRKCARAHKGVLNLSCILYPEKLSIDGRNTVYHAEQEYKDYL